MKFCFKCNLEKPLSEYYKHGSMKDGHLNKCKSCTKSDVKNNLEDYDLTEKGVIRVMYGTQKFNSKKRNHAPPKYSKNELKLWLYDHGFKALFDSWANAKHKKDLKPSIDRINDFKPYSLKNIRLVTWAENRNHQYSDIKNGIGTSGERCKKVYQYTKGLSFIGVHHSQAAAARLTGNSSQAISCNVRGVTKSSGGYVWSPVQL